MAKFIRLAAIIAIGFAVAWFASSASAQTAQSGTGAVKTIKEQPVRPLGDVAGATTFREYCSTCHGVGGHGNGPAASALKTAPSDLTLIARRAGGTFPFGTVKSKITGDDVVAAHGSRDMPTWGPLFKAVDTSSSVAELRLTNLINYLEGIQAK
jgi:mono/diheme cytochrome c family protein